MLPESESHVDDDDLPCLILRHGPKGEAAARKAASGYQGQSVIIEDPDIPPGVSDGSFVPENSPQWKAATGTKTK